MSDEHTTPDADRPDQRDGAGFVPRLGADPSTARYELLTAAQAVERVAAVAFDRADAVRMVEQYLAQNTAAVGAPSGDGWRIDPFDLSEIARAYDWVDHYQGETVADARTRAGGDSRNSRHERVRKRQKSRNHDQVRRREQHDHARDRPAEVREGGGRPGQRRANTSECRTDGNPHLQRRHADRLPA